MPVANVASWRQGECPGLFIQKHWPSAAVWSQCQGCTDIFTHIHISKLQSFFFAHFHQEDRSWKHRALIRRRKQWTRCERRPGGKNSYKKTENEPVTCLFTRDEIRPHLDDDDDDDES